EGDSISYTVTLTGPAGMDLSQHGGLTFTLDNGETVTIANGAISGSSAPVTVADDPLVGGQPAIANQITGVEVTAGGETFEHLVLDPTATQVTVTDEPNGQGDSTRLSLGDISVNEGSGTATVTGTLSHPAGMAFTVTLSNQATL
ncbi:immunoglobulin-like domain-containing protein, partial [Oceanisphaera sediminis]|uniref:immunoglobulin-like domain-containing protein n=1 Tax=Oceanisphaera sediminis TaxID=981381 RepID=UPI0031EFC5E7